MVNEGRVGDLSLLMASIAVLRGVPYPEVEDNTWLSERKGWHWGRCSINVQ